MILRGNVLAIIVAVVPLALTGCSGDGRVAVSGSVTVDGEPLPSGSISFRPVDPRQANTSGAAILDGRFRIPSDKGLFPGEYEVRISAYEEGDGFWNDPQRGRIPEMVPVRFRESQPIPTTIEPGGHRIDFHLTKAP